MIDHSANIGSQRDVRFDGRSNETRKMRNKRKKEDFQRNRGQGRPRSNWKVRSAVSRTREPAHDWAMKIK